METTDLIKAIRNCASPYNRKCDNCPHDDKGWPDCTDVLLNEAADRLEELDERVAIMSEGEQVTMEELVKGGEE